MTRNRVSKLMENETWMNARKAVELGFADGILFADGEGENDESEVEAAWQPYSTRAMGQAILNRLVPPAEEDEPVAETGELSVEGTAEKPPEGNEVRIGMDGRTPDGAMPYEILKDKLEWLQ